MTLVADTGGLYALYDADDTRHIQVRRVIEQERGSIIIPMAILAELDYLLQEFLGVDAELDFLDGIVSGAYTLEPLMAIDIKRCRELIATCLAACECLNYHNSNDRTRFIIPLHGGL